MRRRVQIGAPARAFRRADPAIVMVACRTGFLIYSSRPMMLSRDWLAVLAAALLILLVKLGIASGIPW